MSRRIMVLVIAILLAAGGVYWFVNRKGPAGSNPEDRHLRVQLPNGQFVEAVQINREVPPTPDLNKPYTFRSDVKLTPMKPPSGARVIFWATVVRQIDASRNNLPVIVLQDDSGRMMLPRNTPFVNALANNVNSKVKVKGTFFGAKSSYRDYQSFWIDDVLETI